MNGDMILILDFGGAQSHSVARKVRGEKVYCEVLPFDAPIERVRGRNPKGIILVGGSGDAFAPGAPDCDPAVYSSGLPMLAIGYGSRALLRAMGGRSRGPALTRQTMEVSFSPSPLFTGLTASERFIERLDLIDLPEGFSPIASGVADGGGLTAAFSFEEKKLYGMQFSAEQNDPDGLAILANFARGIAGCAPWWSMDVFIEQEVARIRERVGGGSALMGISGGVDSAVCAALMHRAIGRRMHCVYVDTGLMRKGETELVRRLFGEQMDMQLVVVDARERFLARLAGVTDPDQKRRAIGDEFVRAFEDEARTIGHVEFLVQGTIYPDVIQSFGATDSLMMGARGDAPLFEAVLEPVRALFKDEVRQVGEALGMSREIVGRQPFPGVGLALRCVGEVTERKLATLREADAIFREEIEAAGLDRRIWQYFAVLTDMRSVGVAPGGREYGQVVALRAVSSVDATTAIAYRLPYDLLERVVSRITAEAPDVARVVYDVTGKPPAMIEWE
ncbi:MAG: glutamine-hydrolyzing GMP synthase [Clostridiales bacterium]|nr:glutamine-hydrolyzing GMP synthase [Clostridiales bacterium]